MKKIDPCLHGHSRAIVIIALVRLLAAMLAPGNSESRETYLREIPRTIRNILNEMDRMMGRAQRKPGRE